MLAPELLKKTEEESGLLVNHSTPDFAAAQRQISRSLVESHQYQEDVTDAAETSSVQVSSFHFCKSSQLVVVL